MRYLIMCRSLTYAQKAAALLERNGIVCGVSRAPAGLTGRGCAYCLTVSAAKVGQAAAVLRRESALTGKIYEQTDGNTYREVGF